MNLISKYDKDFKVKYTAIIESIPGNRFRITAMFISGFLILNRITEVAYATISTNMVEIAQVKHAMIKVFRNHCGNCATESG